MPTQTAYLPLVSYPETIPDDAILATLNFAASIGCDLHVTTFSVKIPQLRSPLGVLLVDVPALVQAAEEKSRSECRRLKDYVQKAAGQKTRLTVTNREIVFGAALDTASAEARNYALALIPWSADARAINDMADAVVFGSGRPTIVVPSTSTPPMKLDRIAVAWDGSRVAARALWDALTLFPDSQITLITIGDEKPLSRPDLASSLSSSLKERGYNAVPLDITLGDRTISTALQDSAIDAGAELLAMGGFGHSRIRDFVLGGATKGTLVDLRLPVLFSH
jgi:nucleotide-binding universal stress UspA family protein